MTTQFGNIFNNVKAGSLITINLSPITFSDPFGIMALTLFIRSLSKDRGLRTHLILPNDQNANSYLCNSGFLSYSSDYIQYVQNYVPINSPSDRLLGQSTNFIPLTPILKEQDIGEINNKVERFLTLNSYHYSMEEINDIQVMISELCQNVIYHSESNSDYRGLFSMQGYKPKKSGTRKFCIFSIADAGVGIKNSLQKNPLYYDQVFSDCKAISLALKEGVSRIENDFRGNGLYDLNRLTKKHRANLYIHSHGGLVSYTYRDSGRIKEEHEIFPVYGTHVCFSLEEKNIS